MSQELELTRLREEHRTLVALLSKRALTETESARLVALRKRLDEIHQTETRGGAENPAAEIKTFLGTVDRAMHAGQTPSDRIGRIR